jgi:tetratricopeptide (TPR) repeat protein
MKISRMARHLLPVLLMLSFLPSPAAAQAEPRTAARAHFENGVAAFSDRRFGEAADEFEAAYRLSPAFAVLYNIGQVRIALGRSVEAVEAFEKYLDQGAGKIPPERRREVEREIEAQRARIGTVTVRTQPQGAEVRIDGRAVGRTPLGRPVRLNPGKHTVEAVLSGHEVEAQELDLRGAAPAEVVLELKQIVPASALASAPRSTVTPTSPPSMTVAPRAVPAEAAPSGQWRRTTGYLVAGLGAVAIGTGAVVALNGADRARDAKDRLSRATAGDLWDEAKLDYDHGRSRNRLGWTIVGTGAAALAGGVVLLITSPDLKMSASLRVAPVIAANAGGAIVEGIW